jgi:hypothetical protein
VLKTKQRFIKFRILHGRPTFSEFVIQGYNPKQDFTLHQVLDLP